MIAGRNLSPVTRKYLGGLSALTLVCILCVAFSISGNDDFDLARREILLRRVGHEILLQSGDSTSRVLPVKRINNNEYQVSFERPLTFDPESLVNITQRLLASDPLGSDFIVNVLNPANSSVTYGYAISKNRKDDFISCLGRKQPVAPYLLDIKFKSAGPITARTGYFLGALSLLGLVGFTLLRPVKQKPAFAGTPETVGGIRLGSFLFDPEARTLESNGNTVDLTRTEARVLQIFALTPNALIERDRLQKEIWEDEGIIVGRSLDMFISKLRKKLEVDPDVRIVVIRGKGYRLQCQV